MPVEGFPDASKHKICIRCHRWFEPEEGDMVYSWRGSSLPIFTDLAGFVRSTRGAVASAVGDETAMRSICHECKRKRRRRKLAVYAIFALLLAVVLLLELSGRLE